MLRALPFVLVVALFIAFWWQWLAWGILFVCSNGVILNDVLSSSWHSSTCWVSSISWIVVDIRGLVANEISCPWFLFVWVVSYHWWRHPPLGCQSVVAWEVACGLILQGWFWCIPLHAPWCRVQQVLLWWLMTCRSLWCAQCLILRHCLVVWWGHLIGKNVPRLCCMLWVHSSSFRRCVLLTPYRWCDKRVLHPPVWLDNWGVEVFAASYLWLVLTIGMWWHWLGKVGCCPMLCLGTRIFCILVEWSVWPCHLAWVQSIPVLRIVSWCHIELVRSDKVIAVVCRQCVGIVSRLSSRSLALINALVDFCSPSPMWSQCIVFLSNRRWVCNVPRVCFWDAGHVPCQHISPQSHPRLMWIVLAICCVSKDQ